MAASNASRVRACTRRKNVLSFEKAPSRGLKAGLERGKTTNGQPQASRRSRTAWAFWTEQLIPEHRLAGP